MPCPNCLCQSCAKERAKPANEWYLDDNGAYYLTRDGVHVAVVYLRKDGWIWWDFTPACGIGPFDDEEAAMKAAEEATR